MNEKILFLLGFLLSGPITIAQHKEAPIQYSQEPQSNYFAGGALNFISQKNTFPLTGLSAISGIGGIYSNSTEDSKNVTFSFTSYLGKQILSSIEAGILIEYQINQFNTYQSYLFGIPTPVDIKRTAQHRGIGLFSRFLLSPNKIFSLFLQPQISMYQLFEEQFQNENSVSKEKANYLFSALGIGMLYRLSDKMRLTMKLGGIQFSSGKWEIANTDTYKKFSALSTNLNLSSALLGIEILF